MSNQIFKCYEPEEYRKAGATDLVELLPVPGGNSLFIMKWILETLVGGLVGNEMIHLSGPTGSAKSSLIEALYIRKENFRSVCEALGFTFKPIRLFPVEMAIYETPGELYQRRALKGGTTFDEKSGLVQALQQADECKKDCYPVIWLREMGRVHSSSVQGGLLNLMTKGEIFLPDGTTIPGDQISWIADSNYQAEENATHTLVTLDDALKRRFTINLTLDYLPAEQEEMVLAQLLKSDAKEAVDIGMVRKIVHLGNIIRRHRNEGNLLSVIPPTIYGFCAFFRMTAAMPHIHLQQVIMMTLLGNASAGDQNMIPGLLNEVFGLQSEKDEVVELTENLF